MKTAPYNELLLSGGEPLLRLKLWIAKKHGVSVVKELKLSYHNMRI